MHVPCAEVLWDYWTEADGDFRAAFVRWADELTTRYDQAVAEGRWRSGPDLTADADAIAAALRARGNKQADLLRPLLAPLYTTGVSLRYVAEQTRLPLRTVIGALLSTKCMARADSYADMDEAIIAAIGSKIDMPHAQFMAQFGLPPNRSKSMERMCEVHGVARPSHDPRSPLRDEAVQLLRDGHGPSAVIRILRERHPESEVAQRLSKGTVGQWKKRLLVNA